MLTSFPATQVVFSSVSIVASSVFSVLFLELCLAAEYSYLKLKLISSAAHCVEVPSACSWTVGGLVGVHHNLAHLFSHPSRYMYSRNFSSTTDFNARSSNLRVVFHLQLAILLPSPLSDSSLSQYIIWFGVVGVGQHWWTCEGSM